MLVLGGLVRGAAREKLRPQLEHIAIGLTEDEVAKNLDDDYQREMIICLEALMTVADRDVAAVAEYIFQVEPLPFSPLSLQPNETSSLCQ